MMSGSVDCVDADDTKKAEGASASALHIPNHHLQQVIIIIKPHGYCLGLHLECLTVYQTVSAADYHQIVRYSSLDMARLLLGL